MAGHPGRRGGVGGREANRGGVGGGARRRPAHGTGLTDDDVRAALASPPGRAATTAGRRWPAWPRDLGVAKRRVYQLALEVRGRRAPKPGRAGSRRPRSLVRCPAASMSRRRSTTSTTRPTSAPPTPTSPPTPWPGGTACSATTCFSSPAPTSTASRSSGRPRPTASRRSSRPTRPAPRFREAWELLDISYDDFIRTTEPRHYRGRRQRSCRRPTTTAGSSSAPTRACTACRCEAYYTEDGPRSTAACARSTSRPVELLEGGQLLLQAVGLHRPPARVVRGQPRRGHPRVQAQRGHRADQQAACRTSPSPAPRSPGACRCRGTRPTCSTSGTTR